MFLNNAEQFVVRYFYIYTSPRLDKWKARMRLVEFIWMARTEGRKSHKWPTRPVAEVIVSSKWDSPGEK